MIQQTVFVSLALQEQQDTLENLLDILRIAQSLILKFLATILVATPLQDITGIQQTLLVSIAEQEQIQQE